MYVHMYICCIHSCIYERVCKSIMSMLNQIRRKEKMKGKHSSREGTLKAKGEGDERGLEEAIGNVEYQGNG